MAVTTYETVFIAEPETPADQIEQLIARIKQTIGSHQGTVTGEDRWGRRRMAYSIHGHREGFYTVLNYTAEPTVVMALEHLFNVADAVIRHLTIKVIKKNKKFAPRRERPAGAAEGHRSGGPRSSGPSRPREGTTPLPTVTPPPAAAPAVPTAPATPAAAAAPTPQPGAPS